MHIGPCVSDKRRANFTFYTRVRLRLCCVRHARQQREFKVKEVNKNNSLILGDLTRLELALILPLLFATVIFGLFPNVILDSLHYDVSKLLYSII